MAAQRSSPAIRTRAARRASASRSSQSATSVPGTVRAAISSTVSGPSSRSRSATPSTSLGLAVGREPLQLGLDLGEHLGVEQLAQLGAAEQLGEQALVEREGGGPALGDG